MKTYNEFYESDKKFDTRLNGKNKIIKFFKKIKRKIFGPSARDIAIAMWYVGDE